MADGLRITPDQLKRRMQAGEQFTIIDTRNPQAWAEASDTAPGAIRFHGDDVSEILPRVPRDKPIVAFCT